MISKLENFIEKTKIVKEKKKQINHGVAKTENEIYKTKEEELDSYIKQIKINKAEIKKLRNELEADKNF